MKYVFQEDNGDVSSVEYIPKYLDDISAQQLFNQLERMDDFKNGTTYFGEIPRVQKWYQTDKKYFNESWKRRFPRWESHIYEPYIMDLQKQLSQKYDILLNSCLINKYRTGADSIKAHQDNQESFGESPTIFGISCGESRKIKFTRVIPGTLKYDKDRSDNFEINLEGGSLLIMDGYTQKYFVHEIPKTNQNSGIRYSLTFRHFDRESKGNK